MSGLALAALLFVGLAKSRSNQSGGPRRLCLPAALQRALTALQVGRQLTRSDFAASAKRIFAVMMLILAYSLCSSMLLILNKVRAQLLPGRALALLQQRPLCHTRDAHRSRAQCFQPQRLLWHRAPTLDAQALQKARKWCGM